MIDQTCTSVQLADLLGLSEQRVGVLTKNGVLSRGPKGYDIRTAVRSYVQFLRSEPAALTDERARLTKAQADMAELKYRVRCGELVSRAAVERFQFAIAHEVKDALFNIRPRVNGLLLAAAQSSKDPYTAQHAMGEILDRELTQALSALTGGERSDHDS
jgi:phage terminase Nu1 subunit (DNA packaging protein)